MKKSLILSALLFLFVTSPVAAQSNDIKYGDIPQTSGFVDENGDPVSIEDYEKMRQESMKNVFQRYPIPSALVAVAVVGSVAYTVNRRKR